MSEAIGSAHVRFSASTGKFEADVDKAQSKLQQFSKSADKTAKELSKVRSAASGLAAGAGSFTRLAESGARAAGANEAFTASLGSASSAVWSAQHAVIALTVAKKALQGPVGWAIAGISALAAGLLYMRSQSAEATEEDKKRTGATQDGTKAIENRVAALRSSSQMLEIHQARLDGATADTIAWIQALHREEEALRRQNELKQSALRLAGELLTDESKFNRQRSEYIRMLDAGLITQEQYAQAVDRARIAFLGLSDAEMHQQKLLEGAAQIRAEAVTHLQRYDHRVRDLDAMQRQGLITSAQYSAEVLKARDAFTAATPKSEEYLASQKALRDHLSERASLTGQATALLSSYRSEEDRTVASIVLAAKAYEANIYTAEEYARVIKNLTAVTKENTDVETQMRLQATENISGALVALTAISAKESKKQFELHKKVSMADAIVNTAAGVTRAFKDLPPWAAWPQAALIAANGAAQLAAIRSTSFEGGGAITTPQDAGSSTASAPTTNVTLNLRGDEIFTGASIGRVFEQFNEYLKDGGSLNVQVN
jgi:hypothetical protein